MEHYLPPSLAQTCNKKTPWPCVCTGFVPQFLESSIISPWLKGDACGSAISLLVSMQATPRGARNQLKCLSSALPLTPHKLQDVTGWKGTALWTSKPRWHPLNQRALSSSNESDIQMRLLVLHASVLDTELLYKVKESIIRHPATLEVICRLSSEKNFVFNKKISKPHKNQGI